MIIRLGHEERATFQRGATERTRALISAIDARLKSSIAIIVSLATSPSLTDDELEVFRDRSARILKSQPDWVTIHLALPSGQQVMNVLRPLGSDLPKQPRDLQSFERVLRTAKPAVGGLVHDPVTQRHEFVVRVPVVRDGAVKYVITALVKPQSMNELLAAQRLPPDWIGVVLDGNGRFVARTIQPESSVGQSASESLRAALDRSSEGWFQGTTVEGWDVYTPYSRSSFSGWTVALGIPADVVDATLRRSMLYLVFFGIGLLALSLLIAWIFSNRTAASITSLAVIAQDVAAGKSSLVADSSTTPNPRSRGCAKRLRDRASIAKRASPKKKSASPSGSNSR